MSDPDPDCKACRGSGLILYDTDHLGEASGWNPGVVRLRCECWPLSAEQQKTIDEFMAEIEEENNE